MTAKRLFAGFTCVAAVIAAAQVTVAQEGITPEQINAFKRGVQDGDMTAACILRALQAEGILKEDRDWVSIAQRASRINAGVTVTLQTEIIGREELEARRARPVQDVLAEANRSQRDVSAETAEDICARLVRVDTDDEAPAAPQ